MAEPAIEDVEFKGLVTHADERAFDREILRQSDPVFDQSSPIDGTLMEFFLGDRYGARCVKIPPGVAHGCRALELTHLLYVTSNVYDPADEGRIPHDDASIGYDWTAAPPIK